MTCSFELHAYAVTPTGDSYWVSDGWIFPWCATKAASSTAAAPFRHVAVTLEWEGTGELVGAVWNLKIGNMTYAVDGPQGKTTFEADVESVKVWGFAELTGQAGAVANLSADVSFAFS